MIKHLFTSILLLFSLAGSAQSNYFPPKPEGYSEEKYQFGRKNLENTYQQMKDADNGIVGTDYWNMAVNYHTMGQPVDSIFALLVKAKAMDDGSMCEIVNFIAKQNGGLEQSGFYKLLGDRYLELVSDCSSLPEEKIDLEKYASDGNYELALVKELDRIRNQDRKYRIANKMEEQLPLDLQNQKDLERIIRKYGYPGRSLVGKKYEHVAFMVIQHADLEYHERYLPLVYQAVLNNELAQTPCKMLIDRIYTKREGYQIFGSQPGIPFGTDEEIETAKAIYPFN